MKRFFLLAILLVSIGCTTKVCDIGAISVTSKDISYRARVSEVYYPGSGKDYVGLAQLLKGYLSEEVLKSLGHKVDSSVIEAEAKRIDENTKAPEVLARIKEIYGRNRKAYLKTFVRVVYAERVLYNEVFLNSKEIHKDQYQKAQGFLKAVLGSPASFEKIARKKGLDVRRLRLSKSEGIMPLESQKTKLPLREASGSGGEMAARLLGLLTGVKEGKVYPQVIEWQEGYQVIRLLKKKGDTAVIESMSVPKRDYDDWFWEKAKAVPVKIYDKALREKLLNEVSWAKQLSL